MRISDWSSDVCSSDLFAEPRDAAFSLDLDDQECLRADLCLGELVCPADRQIDDRGFDGADAQGVLCQVSRSNDGRNHLVHALPSFRSGLSAGLIDEGCGTSGVTSTRSEAHTSELQSLMRR